MGIGEWSKRVGISGMTWKSLKSHYAIIPIYAICVIGLALPSAYVYRLATKHPEVSWTRANPEPWNEYRNKQYKFLSTGRNYDCPNPAPKYK